MEDQLTAGHNCFYRILILFNYDEVFFLKQCLLEPNACWMQFEWVLLSHLICLEIDTFCTLFP